MSKKKRIINRNEIIDQKKLIIIYFIKFNNDFIIQNKNEFIYFNQEKQFKNFRIIFKIFKNFINSKNEIRKTINFKN